MKKPAWYFYLLQICMLIINLAGLMSLSQEKIKWNGVFADIVNSYSKYISQPIRNYLAYLEEKFNISLDWVPIWFPDYLPIASAFFFAFIVSCTYKNNTTIFVILSEFFKGLREIWRDENIGPVIIILTICLILLVVSFLLSPIIIVVVPLLLFFYAYIFFGLFFIYIKLLTTYVLPYVALILFAAYSFYAYKYEDGKVLELISSKLMSIFKSTIKGISRCFRHIRVFLKRFRKKIKNKDSDFRHELTKSFGFVADIIIFQYKIVMLLALMFLIAFAINQSAL